MAAHNVDDARNGAAHVIGQLAAIHREDGLIVLLVGLEVDRAAGVLGRVARDLAAVQDQGRVFHIECTALCTEAIRDNGVVHRHRRIVHQIDGVARGSGSGQFGEDLGIAVDRDVRQRQAAAVHGDHVARAGRSALDDAVAALEVPRLLIEHGHGVRDPDDTVGDLRRDESRSRSKRADRGLLRQAVVGVAALDTVQIDRRADIGVVEPIGKERHVVRDRSREIPFRAAGGVPAKEGIVSLDGIGGLFDRAAVLDLDLHRCRAVDGIERDGMLDQAVRQCDGDVLGQTGQDVVAAVARQTAARCGDVIDRIAFVSAGDKLDKVHILRERQLRDGLAFDIGRAVLGDEGDVDRLLRLGGLGLGRLGLRGLWLRRFGLRRLRGLGLILRSLQEAAQERSGLSAGQRVLRQEAAVRIAGQDTCRLHGLHSLFRPGGDVGCIGEGLNLLDLGEGLVQQLQQPQEDGGSLLPGGRAVRGKRAVAVAGHNAVLGGPCDSARVPGAHCYIGEAGRGIVVRFRTDGARQNGHKHGTGQRALGIKHRVAHALEVTGGNGFRDGVIRPVVL